MAGAVVIARQEGGVLFWKHTNPVTNDELETTAQRVVSGKVMVDPQGIALGDTNPFDPPSSGGNEGGVSQAQMNSRYAQLSADFGGGFRCALNDLYMDCGSMPNVIDNGPAPTPLERRYGRVSQYGFSMPEWAWEQLSQQNWRKQYDVLLGRDSFEAKPPTVWFGVPQKSAAVNPQTLKDIKTCALILYGVEVKDFKLASPGRSGSFVGFGFDRDKGEYTDIRIDTNVTSYDRADLNTFYASFVKDHSGVLMPQRAGNNAWGLTLPNSMVHYGDKPGVGFSPYLNFLANDIPKQWRNAAWFQALQIHEIGHSLAFLTRDKLGLEDGKEFEDCVYDGPKATWKKMNK